MNSFLKIENWPSPGSIGWMKLGAALYLLSIPFQWPVWGEKLKISELVFIIFIIPALMTNLRKRSFSINYVDAGMLAYLAGTSASVVCGGFERTSVLYLGIAFYLACVFLFFKILTERLAGEAFVFFEKWILWMAVLAASTGTAGWLLAAFGVENQLVVFRESYLYVHGIVRAQGFAVGPNMLASLLNFGWLMFLSKTIFQSKPLSKLDFGIGLMLLLGLFSTLSKFILLSFAGLFFLFFILKKAGLRQAKFLKKLPSSAFKILAILCLLVLFYLIHFYIGTSQNTDNQLNRGTDYVTQTPIELPDGLLFYEGVNLILKKMSLLAFVENPVCGIGPGQHQNFCFQKQQTGEYPAYFNPMEPHSTWLGALAEGGLLLALPLIFWMLQISKSLQALDFQRVPVHWIAFLTVFFAYVFWEGWFAETNTFRQIWLVLGILSGVTRR